MNQTNTTLSQKKSEEELEYEVALKISRQIERNIIKHRDHTSLANKLSAMNKYIQISYIQKLLFSAA